MAYIVINILLLFLFASFVGTIVANDVCDAILIGILMFSSMITGINLKDHNSIDINEYLKSPESYQVDTFMVNGVLDHYEVSKKSK